MKYLVLLFLVGCSGTKIVADDGDTFFVKHDTRAWGEDPKVIADQRCAPKKAKIVQLIQGNEEYAPRIQYRCE